MKILVFLITIILNSNNDKLFGLWKSIEENNPNYINLKPNGDFFKKYDKEAKKIISMEKDWEVLVSRLNTLKKERNL